ncbi:MAG: DUF503 domain-containing protein [Dehalococcoidia bacterium]
MKIGVCKVKLRLPGNRSLKGKRQVLRSIKDRLRNKFNISVAEVEDHQLWQLMTLGLACVSNDTRHLNEVMSKVVNFIESIKGDAELLDYEVEIIHDL